MSTDSGPAVPSEPAVSDIPHPAAAGVPSEPAVSDIPHPAAAGVPSEPAVSDVPPLPVEPPEGPGDDDLDERVRRLDAVEADLRARLGALDGR